jgi:hypothetical protein
MMRHNAIAFFPLFLTLFAVAFFVPLFSHAQISNPSDSSNTLSTTITPEFPRPNEFVTISIENYGTDLNAATIRWSLNGKVVLEGVGKKKFSFDVGSIGTPSKVTVTVSPLNGAPFQNDIFISPTSVNLIWEANTYTPPFYKGKALFSGQSSVTIAAVPELGGSQSLIPPDSLIYNWVLNEKTLYGESGYGKKGLKFSGNYWGRDDVVTLNVSSIDGSINSQNTLTLKPVNPFVLIYEDNPLLGVLYNHAVFGTFSLTKGSEVSFFAAPFNFKNNAISNGKTKFSWQMNGRDVSGQSNGNTVTFRNDAGGNGASSLGVRVSQENEDFQNASAGFSLNFK